MADELLSSRVAAVARGNATRHQVRELAGEVRDLERRAASLEVREPGIYDRGSGNSYYFDLARVNLKRGETDAAIERLRRHMAEVALSAPRRDAERRARAEALLETALTSDPQAARAYEKFLATGRQPFERRFVSRVPGNMGSFVPPLWALSDYVPFARPKRVLADLVASFPLPPNTDSINIPKVPVGAATGPQVADGGPVGGRDIDDAFVNVPVRTIASLSDWSLQAVEQSGLNMIADDLVHQDLLSDYDAQLTGLILVGSGVNGQPSGLIPGGVVSASNAILVTNSNNVTPQTVLTAASGDTLYTSVHKGASLVARTRAVPSSEVAIVVHPWQWEQYAALTTTTAQPVIIDQDPALAPGQAGWWNSKRVYTDPALPVTFGNTGLNAPTMGAVSAGQFPVIPGTGPYSVALAGRWADSWLFEKEAVVETMLEVLSGDLQVRFRLKSYVAFLPNRYTAAAAVGSVLAAGGAVNYAVVNQYQANSPWQLSGSGF